MPKKLMTKRNQSRNRAAWRRDLINQNGNWDYDPDSIHARVYSDQETVSTETWNVLGRGLQLIIDRSMFDDQHPDFGGSGPMDWAWGDPLLEPSEHVDAYPVGVPALFDVNLSAFTGLEEVIDIAYGFDHEAQRRMDQAETDGATLTEIARLIV